MAGTFHSVSYKLLKELQVNNFKQPNELKHYLNQFMKKFFFERNDETNPYDGGYLYDMYSLF